MKKCPFCAGEIQDEAIVCRHCGRDLRQPVSHVQLAPQSALNQAKNPYSPRKRKAINAAVIIIGLCMGCLFITNFAQNPKPKPNPVILSETAILSSVEYHTLTPTTTLTDTPTQKPPDSTATPPLMDTDYLMTALEGGLNYSNQKYNEKMTALSASYEGIEAKKPTRLLIKIQDGSKTDHSGCLEPLPIIAYSLIERNSKTVFPSSLEDIGVECYDSSSRLLLSYHVSFDDMIDFGSASNIDMERVYVIENNLATFTPTAQATRTAKPTSPPAQSTVDPLANVTAICMDGTYSYSQHRSGTCSHHGGVKQWIHKPPS
jgi:hypothetical protein